MSAHAHVDRPEQARVNRWSPAQLVALRVLADLLAIVLAFGLFFQMYGVTVGRGWIDRSVPAPGPYVVIAAVFAALTLLVFARQRLYRGRATVLNLWELETVVKGVLLSAALLFASLFFVRLQFDSRYVVIGAIGTAAVLLLLERRLLSSLVRRLQRMGTAGSRTLIYGCEKTGQLLMKKVLEAPHLGATVVGFLDDDVPLGSRVFCRITQTDPRLFEAPVLGRFEDLERVVEELEVEDLLIVDSSLGPERQREAIERAESLGLKVGVVPSLGDVRSDQLRVEELSAIPVLRPATPSSRRLGRWAKEAFDLVASVVLLVLSAPAWIVSAIAIRWESGSPVLFAQQRVGRDGKPFRVLKFRTMSGDAAPYASSPPGDVDPKITRVGRILRKTGLDELPQLINVIRGEMSLVGPRPEMPHLVQQYGPVERLRLTVKPGVTGLWQLSADRHAEIHENIEYDLYYVHHQSLLLDALILLETAFFTIGVLFGSLDRSSTRPLDEPSRPSPPRADEEYVLVALDQRRDEVLPESWRTCVPAAYAISDRWPVRIVVAEGNRAAVDELLRDSIRRLGADGHRSTYSPYRSRAALKRLVEGARLVVTDLDHVSDWTAEKGVDLLTVERGGLRWWPRTRVPDPVVSRLSDLVTVYIGAQEDISASAFESGATVVSMIRTGS
ncbi:MAG: exopolysaccharide biosynthesis polyprenyl glycosylphosphotransferase [Gemmatimonadetes bacterium]|nr:exopolysaccharide biosynthesis polyprenyl glycosylphosphotransferase [Gemmatimonadota bacterium]